MKDNLSEVLGCVESPLAKNHVGHGTELRERMLADTLHQLLAGEVFGTLWILFEECFERHVQRLNEKGIRFGLIAVVFLTNRGDDLLKILLHDSLFVSNGKACLDLLHLFCGFIRARDPIEGLAVKPGDDVEVDMGDGLRGARAVILKQIEAIAGQAFHQVGGEALDDRDGMFQELLGKFREDVDMLFRDDEKVSLLKGADIEEGDHMIIFVDFCCRDGSLNYFTKDTVHDDLTNRGLIGSGG